MSEATRRLFFALWPDDRVRTRCDWYASAVMGKRCKRVPAANLHLTLGFAGSVNLAVSRCLEQRAAEIQVAPFCLTLDYLGYWHRQRVLWMGPRHTPDELWSLVTIVREVFDVCGVQQERHAFQAHMTLARRFSAALPGASSPDIEWPVSSFSLIQSVNTEKGVSYRVLRQWALASVEHR